MLDFEKYCCPITEKIMADPVIASDGRTYESDAIKEHIRKGAVSLFTGLTLTKTLIPNEDKRMEIKEFLNAHSQELPPDAIYKTRASLLIDAISFGQLEEVIDLIEEDQDFLDNELMPGRTALYVACESGTMEIVDALVKMLDHRDALREKQRSAGQARHYTPPPPPRTMSHIPSDWDPKVLNNELIEIAKQNKNDYSIEYLLRLGANVDAQDEHGKTALDYIMEYQPELSGKFVHHKISPFNQNVGNREYSSSAYAFSVLKMSFDRINRLTNNVNQQSKQIQTLKEHLEQQDRKIALIETQLSKTTKDSVICDKTEPDVKIQSDKVELKKQNNVRSLPVVETFAGMLKELKEQDHYAENGNSRFDHGYWDPKIAHHPDTGAPIFTYRVLNKGHEVGSAEFYNHPLLCRSEDLALHNIIKLTGVLSEFDAQSILDTVEDICEALPPTFSEQVIATSIRAAKHGAIRGAANVVEHGMIAKGFSKQAASYTHHGLYYGSMFTMSCMQHYAQSDDEAPEMQKITSAAYQATWDTGSLFLTNIILKKSCEFASWMGNIAHQHDWNRTGKTFDFFSQYGSYGVYLVHGSATRGPTHAVSSLATGMATEKTINTVGKGTINRFFGDHRAASDVQQANQQPQINGANNNRPTRS